jgi:hypothetical protein
VFAWEGLVDSPGVLAWHFPVRAFRSFVVDVLIDESDHSLDFSLSFIFSGLVGASVWFAICNDGLRQRTMLDVAAVACSVKLS